MHSLFDKTPSFDRERASEIHKLGEHNFQVAFINQDGVNIMELFDPILHATSSPWLEVVLRPGNCKNVRTSSAGDLGFESAVQSHPTQPQCAGTDEVTEMQSAARQALESAKLARGVVHLQNVNHPRTTPVKPSEVPLLELLDRIPNGVSQLYEERFATNVVHGIRGHGGSRKRTTWKFSDWIE